MMARIRHLAVTAPILLAQATQPLGDTGGISYNSLVKIVYGIARLLLQAGEFVAVGFIVFYGLRMVTSQGDPTKFSEARRGLLLALLGAIIIFGAYLIVDTVKSSVESAKSGAMDHMVSLTQL